MSKTIKRIVAVLTMLGMAVGVVGVPQVSEAASFTFSYPAETMYVEILNKQGDEFAQSLNMEAVFVKAVYYPPNSQWSSVVAEPLTVTKQGSTNKFAFSIPAVVNATTQDKNLPYYQLVKNIKISTPILTATNIIGTNDITSKEYREFYGGWIGPGYTQANHVFTTKNADNTWNINIGDNSNFPHALPGYMGGRFGARTLSVGDYANTGAFVAYGIDGETFKVYIITPQVQEIFEDETGAAITPPTGYTNNKFTDVLIQPQTYQMDQDTNLPMTYTDSGFKYTYEGWYKGAGNKASMNPTHPPSIGFNAGLSDADNEVHIVYKKRAIRVLNEEYIDTSSATIEPSWNNMGQTTTDGDTFTQTPAPTKTDSGGIVWEYQGWKLDTEPMSAIRTTPVSHTISGNTTIQYVYRKKQHSITEKWVDQSDGSTLIPMTGNPKTSPIDDNDNFTGTASATITDTHGAIWDYVGWENVTDNAGIVNPSASYAVNTIKAAKEIRYHYQARNTTATLDLNPTPQVTASGGSVSWSSRLTNTGTSTLNNLKLKATSNWASGLSEPTQVTVTPAGGAPQNFTVTPVDWVGGFNLTGINVPNGGPNNYADITFTDTATGAVNQVLPAEIEIDGNMANSLKAENFVRIDDPDEPNLKPLGNAGLINIPDFRFGDVEVKPFAQTKGLDAASYQAGYKPYIRFKDQESLSGWSLTTKLGQFISGSKTLPATTSIQLKNGDLKEVQNYNKSNESLSSVSSIGNKVIASDSTTVALTNGAAQGVYQLDYAFNDVELDLLAHSGIAGLSYTADMDWTLTTAP